MSAQGWAAVPNWLARDTSVSIYAKAVYLVLSSRADADGIAWPSYATMAAEAGCSRRKAIDAVAELQVLGVLSVEQRLDASTGQKSNAYRISVHRAQQSGGVHAVHPPVQEVHRPSAHGAPEEEPLKKNHAPAEPVALIPSEDDTVVDAWVGLQRKAGKAPRPVASATRKAVRSLLADGVPVDRIVAVLTWAHTDELRGSWWTNTGRLTLGTLRRHWATVDAQCPAGYQPPVDTSARRAAAEAAVLERTLQYAGLTEPEFAALPAADRRELTWRAEEDEARRALPAPDQVQAAPSDVQAAGAPSGARVAPSMVPDAWA